MTFKDRAEGAVLSSSTVRTWVSPTAIPSGHLQSQGHRVYCPILLNYGDFCVGIAPAYGWQSIFLAAGKKIGSMLTILIPSPIIGIPREGD